MLLRHNLHQVPLSIYYLCFVAYYLVAIIHNITLCLLFSFDFLPFLQFEKVMAILKKTDNYGSIENVSNYE